MDQREELKNKHKGGILTEQDGEVKININGNSYLSAPGETILEVSIQNNIF
ncbi:unnamed protein product, partial [marine sediment metagenome]